MYRKPRNENEFTQLVIKIAKDEFDYDYSTSDIDMNIKGNEIAGSYQRGTHKLAFNPVLLDYSIQDILDTIRHELVHRLTLDKTPVATDHGIDFMRNAVQHKVSIFNYLIPDVGMTLLGLCLMYSAYVNLNLKYALGLTMIYFSVYGMIYKKAQHN